ncbi:hypothetical protein JCM10207_002533 [Rhodosporidiobolus poonsookiae]
MASLRSSRKTAQLANALHSLRAGPSARPLPALVAGLSLRSEGVKGNAGARHWAKIVLPALHHANPQLSISLEKVQTAEAAGAEPWSQSPGLTVTFNDPSLAPAFFPLPAQKSDNLAKRFWATFGSEAAVRAFAEGKVIEPTPEVEQARGEVQAEGVEQAQAPLA